MKKKETKDVEKNVEETCECGCGCTPDCTCGCQEGEVCTCRSEECDCECECTKEDETCNCGCCEDESSGCREDLYEDKLNEAYNKISYLEDSILRSKAEFINYRKRLEEEHIRSLKFSNEDLIKEILPVIDNFERAIDMEEDNLDDETAKFLSGFKMMYCTLLGVLKKYDVIEIDGINKPFDANYHEAVITELRDKVEPGMVLEVMQKGYILKGKVIRPAMVKVSE